MQRRQRRWKFIVLFLAIFFSLPIIAAKIPLWAEEKPILETSKQDTKIVYAANKTIATNVSEQKNSNSFKTLLYFTHSHEAYAPMLKKRQQAITVYNDSTNVQSLGDLFVNHFKQNHIDADVLNVDTMKVMKQQKMAFYQAYDAVRPYVKKQIDKEGYDLIMDIHRDSAGRKTTTTTYKGMSYARMALVIGGKNKQYQANEAYAEQLSKKLNSLVPGISRGVMKKTGEGVNGIYNQDLSKQIILIELGGIDNNEEELNRSIAILARAIEEAFVEPASS
ncbi:stage II sporulation protein P [Rummeliibacillus pycnus]|uniref:stage II sporulation protein P n=1 Tax=Rummeliibacillus pycnus TaxID=101070 RepID=UPI000C9A0995|nr:stage II sporulation protein P [Rummeliibacillus pycnus]